MNIAKHGKRWRITKMKDGIRYYVSVDEKPSKRQAEEIIQDYIRNNMGMDPDLKKINMAEAGNQYIQLKNNVISPSTIMGYRAIIKSWPEWFKNKPLLSVTAIDVQKLVNDMSATRSPKTVRNVHGFISAVLGTYRDNLILNTQLPLKRKFEAYTPIDDDVQKVLSAVRGSEYEIPYRLAVYGMRKGEICAISAADLNDNWLSINKSFVLTESGKWIVKPFPKTHESIREIYIDNELADMIRSTSDRVFTGYPNRLTKKLHKIQKELSLPLFRFHDFRAYYASMAHAIGIPDACIMKNGGWSSTNILNRAYKKAQNDVNAAANQKIASHVFGVSVD